MAINCAGAVEYAAYDALYAEDSRGIKAGSVVVRDGGLGISHAERAGGVPVGRGFRFDWARMMETVEGGLNVSWYREFAGALYVIPFKGYTAKFCTSPIFMHSFVIFEQDVEEVLGVLLPEILHAKVVNHEGKRNGAGQVCPEARDVFGGSLPVGGRGRMLVLREQGHWLRVDNTSPLRFCRKPSHRGLQTAVSYTLV